jgi:hypothetical protein
MVQLCTIPFLLLIPWSSKEASSALPSVLSNHWAQVHSLVPNDPVNPILPMFSVKCFPLSPTSYPTISTRRVPMQPEPHSLWLLFNVYTYLVYNDSTLLRDLVDAPTTSHHVLRVCARAFTKIDHDTTKNVTDMQYATPRPWHVLKSWSPDPMIFYLSHLVILAIHTHIIIHKQVPCQSV